MSIISDKIKEIADKLEKSVKTLAAIEKAKTTIVKTSAVAASVKQTQSPPKT